jgi:hypothetical protein
LAIVTPLATSLGFLAVDLFFRRATVIRPSSRRNVNFANGQTDIILVHDSPDPQMCLRARLRARAVNWIPRKPLADTISIKLP